MDVTGTGISAFTAKILPGFRPRTKLSIRWRQLSSGNWTGLDRGTSEDKYSASIGIYGKETVINNIIDELNDNRTGDTHTFSCDNFAATEHIFGENVDHSVTITATVLDYSPRAQRTWKGWSLPMVLRHTSAVAFTGSSSLPTLDCCDVGVVADSDYRINKFDTYTGVMSYNDHKSDSGIFEGTFTVSNANMILLRNYIKTQRTGNFSLADNFGIDYPFGSYSANSYPFTTKLIEWEDLGLVGVGKHRIRLKFAEAV